MNKLLFIPCLLLSLLLSAQNKADLIIINGKVATMEKAAAFKQAVAIKDGIIVDAGNTASILAAYKGPATNVIDAKGRTVVPGLNDSHLHAIREGLNYNAELRWDGVTSLKRAMEMLSEQAARTPAGVWIKVVGGWNEYQFEDGKPVYAEGDYSNLNAVVPAVIPDWSPVKYYGGYQNQ